MAIQYVIKLYDDTGTALGIVTPLNLAIVHKINSPSIATFTVNLDAPVVADLDYGYIVSITRADASAGMNAYEEFVGFIRAWTREFGQNRMLTVTAVDAMCILQDRIVAWYPSMRGVSQFTVATYPTASSIITALWNTNVGSDAEGNSPYITAALTRRYALGLQRWTDGRINTATDAVDLSIGASMALTCSGENLLLTMQKIADVGSIDFKVNFDVASLGYSLFYASTLGADRRSYVKLSQLNGTLGTLVKQSSLVNYPTYIIAVGKGKDKNNLRSAWPSTAPTNTDLREAMVKGSDSTTVAQLTSVAKRRYNQEQRKVKSYDVEVLQSSTWRYGRDYFLGDLVSIAVTSSETLSRKIYAVSLAMSSNGAEEVQIDLSNI